MLIESDRYLLLFKGLTNKLFYKKIWEIKIFVEYIYCLYNLYPKKL